MKIKSDFVTNSSSTSYIVNVVVKSEDGKIFFGIDGLKDMYMIDIISMVEGRLRREKFENGFIIFNETIEDLCCDGWGGGDYYFAGNGGAFFGDEQLAEQILEKKDVKIEVKDGRLINYPDSWNIEGEVWMEVLIKEKGVEKVAKLFNVDEEYLNQLWKEGELNER